MKFDILFESLFSESSSSAYFIWPLQFSMSLELFVFSELDSFEDSLEDILSHAALRKYFF